MIIDINTYLGHYPFRPMSNNTAPELTALMDKFGVSQSCVCSMSGIYYRDVMSGNYELLEQLEGYENRFIPFCVINPAYADASNDLDKCFKLGFRGVRLFPRQHNYRLDDIRSIEILKKCAKYELPVQLTVYIEDSRQRHNMDVSDIVSVSEIKAAAEKCPDVNFIISNGYSNSYSSQLRTCDNIYYDLGKTDNLCQDSFTSLLDDVGAKRLLFGTGAPMQYIGVPLVKLNTIKKTDSLTDGDIKLISHLNIKRILKI